MGKWVVKTESGAQKRDSHCKRNHFEVFCPTVHGMKHGPTRDVQAELCSPLGERDRRAPEGCSRVVADQMSIRICSHEPEMPASLGWACGFVDCGIASIKGELRNG